MAASTCSVLFMFLKNKAYIFSNTRTKFIHTQIQLGKWIKTGDVLPDTTVYEHTPNNAIKIRDVFRGKKGILFSLPGAFVPGCSQGHFPEYLAMYDRFVAEGFSILACVCVNDPFVLDAWVKSVDCHSKIRMLADVKGDFTRAVHMELDSKALMGNIRSKRYSFLVDDNVITHINHEPDDTGLSCLLCIERTKVKSSHSSSGQEKQ